MMLGPLVSVLLGVALLYGGAEGLVRSSAALARRLGLTPLVIGLTVVAFGTSMPEMVVSIGATLDGRGAIAVGNVVGSNIGNIALILAISSLIRPPAVGAQVIRVDLPILVGVSVLLLLLLGDGVISRPEGVLLFAGLVGYVTFSLRLARSEPEPIQEEFAEALPLGPKSPALDAVLIAGGLGLLVIGARLLVSGGVTIAEGFGMSEAVIGLTVVAVGTSLPELATSVLAALKGEGDIAIGNVVGSNLFNILGILGLSAIVRPIAATGISAVDMGAMVVLAVVLLPLMRTDWRLARWEAALLLLAYVGYIVYLLV